MITSMSSAIQLHLLLILLLVLRFKTHDEKGEKGVLMFKVKKET